MKKLIFLFTLSLLLVGMAWGQGAEDFTNSNATGSYGDNSFVGNGDITWTYGHSRDEGDFPIDGNGLMLRRASDSYLEATIPGGIGEFTFQYRKAFTGASIRQLELYVNNEQRGITEEFGGATGADETVHTFTVDNINAAGVVSIKIKNVGTATTNKQTVIDNITWTGYTGGGDPQAATPTFNPEAGVYSSPISVAISTATPGAQIRYTTDGSTPSETAGTLYSAPINVYSTTTIKAIAYAGGYLNSVVAMADYSFANDLANIAALRAGAMDGSVYRLTGEAVLTFQQSNRNQKYIQDDTAAILIDDISGIITSTYNLYDGITGITGTLDMYNNLLQFVPVSDPGPATSSGNTVVPETRTLASLSSDDQAKLIKIEDVSFVSTGNFGSYAENLDIEQDGIPYVMRTFPDTDYSGTPIPVVPLHITALVGQFGATMQVSPRFLADFEEAEVEDPTIYVSSASLDGFNYEFDNGPSEYQTFTVSGVNLTNNISISASDNYRIARGLFHGTNLTLPQTDGSVAETAIQVRLIAGLSVGDYPGTITVTSFGAATRTITLSGAVTEPVPPAANLFFSEYIEGSSNNKALEVFNASGAEVDLSNYKMVLYSNGSTTPGNTLVMDGSLAPGAVYVAANAGADQAILDVANISSTVTYFNGDDALALVYIPSDEIVDVFGVIGEQPDSGGWDVAGVTDATKDHTLVRKPTVAQGTTDWASTTGTNADDSDWIVYPLDTFDYLGGHTYTPDAQYVQAPVFDPAAGVYSSPISVSISSATPGAQIRYTTNGSDPTEATGTLYTAPINVSSTTTIKAIAYAVGFQPSSVVTAQYDFPTVVNSIAELRGSAQDGTIYRLASEAVLIFQQSFRGQKFIQDATAAILIDDNAGNITTTYNLNDGITDIIGTLNNFGGMMQFIPTQDAPNITSHNLSIIPQDITIDDVLNNFEDYEAQLVRLNSVTFDDATGNFANGTVYGINGGNNIFRTTFYDVDYIGTAIPTEAQDLVGVLNSRSEGNYFSPRSLADFSPAGSGLDAPVVTITRGVDTVTLTWAAIAGAVGYRVEFADDPYGSYTLYGYTGDTSITLTEQVAEKRFYRVIAIDTPPAR